MSTTHVADPSPPIRRRSRLRRFAQNRGALIGVIFVLLVLVLAAFPGWIAPHDPFRQSLSARFMTPNWDHWLGTDHLGRDYLSRLIYGARPSILAGFQATGIALGFGLPLGIIAAYIGGRTESVLDRTNDALMSLPALLLAMTIVAVLGPGLVNAMYGLGIAFVPRFYRIARAATRDVREEVFVEASRAIGCSTSRIMVRHILPNIMAAVIIQGALTFGSVIVAEASLSFLGLGVQPPQPSWGGQLREAARSIYQGPGLIWAPGIMIILTVLAIQFAADGLRDAFATVDRSADGGRTGGQ